MGNETDLVKAVLIAVAANAATYPSIDETVNAALKTLSSEAHSRYFEYGGVVIKRPDGAFQFTTPVTTNQETQVGIRIPIDLRSQVVATYHSHPEVAGADSHKLSKEDLAAIKQLGVPMYVLDRRSKNILRGEPEPKKEEAVASSNKTY